MMRNQSTLVETKVLPPILLFTFLIIIPLVLVVYPLNGSNTPHLLFVLILQWTVILYTAARLTMLSWHGQPRWMAIVFWCFSYTWFGVAGLAQVTSGRTPLQTLVDDGLAIRQLLVILCGFVCYDVAGRLLRPRNVDIAQHRERTLSARRVTQLGVVSVLVAPIIIAVLGNVSALLSSRNAVTSNLISSGLYDRNLTLAGVDGGSGNATGGAIVAVGHALPFLALFSLVWLWRSDLTSRRKFGLQVLFVVLLASNAILNNPISSARYWVLTIVLSFVFIIPRLQRRAGITATISAFVIGATLVFPYLDVFRYDTAHFEERLPVELFIDKTDYGAVTDIALAIQYADRDGHTDGRQILGAILFWVPRALWPEKPLNTAYLIATDIRFPNTNLDSPLWAEGYIDFGWAGVVIFLGIFGAVSARLDDRYVHAHHVWRPGTSVPLPLLFVPCMAAYEPIVIRGSLLQAMNHLAVLVLLLSLLALRRKDGNFSPTDPDQQTQINNNRTVSEHYL